MYVNFSLFDDVFAAKPYDASMTEPILSVRGVSKSYQTTLAHYTLKGMLENSLRNRFTMKTLEKQKEFWALRDISFDLERGETLGIIGRNGAGKTTLLKIIARLTAPTTGSVHLHGSVGSYLGMGVGMHQELSGRENIKLSGSLLGMSRREVSEKMEEIIAFSELEQSIDMPVKFYSSGMRARLAFSIAAHLDEKDILMIDEALAAGDLAFCQKCLKKIQSLVEHGQTALFVSHGMGQVRSLSTRCLYMREGAMAAYGQTDEVIQQYLYDIAEVQQPALAV